MKASRNVFVILLIVGILTIGSAGCISLGTQTNEILVGNQTLGTITITPTDDLFSPNASADRVSVDFNLLTNKSFIDNLSIDDKTTLLKLLTGNDTINLSWFMNDTDTEEETDFWSELMNMKLSGSRDKTLGESFSTPDIDMDTAINDMMDSVSTFLENIKF